MKKFLSVISLCLIFTGCTSVANIDNKGVNLNQSKTNNQILKGTDYEPVINSSNTKLKAIDCQKEQRGCNDIYKPVCGYLQVECIQTPCDPIKQTFGNSCEACRNKRVLSYTEGKCMEDSVKYKENTNNIDINNDLWTTTTNDKGISFQYPKKLLAQYISEAEWPPVVSIDQEFNEFVCDDDSAASSLPERKMRRMVNDRVYCLYALSEGAAGSVYTNYTYSALWNKKTVSINFTLQYPRCVNYDEPQQTECQKERESFDLDNIVDRIFSSLDIFENENY